MVTFIFAGAFLDNILVRAFKILNCKDIIRPDPVWQVSQCIYESLKKHGEIEISVRSAFAEAYQ